MALSLIRARFTTGVAGALIKAVSALGAVERPLQRDKTGAFQRYQTSPPVDALLMPRVVSKRSLFNKNRHWYNFFFVFVHKKTVEKI